MKKKQTFGSNFGRGIKIWLAGIIGGVATIPLYFLIKWFMIQEMLVVSIIFGFVALIWFWVASGYAGYKWLGFK